MFTKTARKNISHFSPSWQRIITSLFPWLRTKVKGKPCEGDMERTTNHCKKYTKGHNYVKTGRKITVPFLCISSNDALYLYKFHEKMRVWMGFIDYWLIALFSVDYWFMAKILVITDFYIEFNMWAPKIKKKNILIFVKITLLLTEGLKF